MSILEAPEMELELPDHPHDGHEAFEAMMDRADEHELLVEEVIFKDGVLGYRVTGPPDKVLRLIPGLYEREVQKRENERMFGFINQMRNVANDPAWQYRQATMQQQMSPRPTQIGLLLGTLGGEIFGIL